MLNTKVGLACDWSHRRPPRGMFLLPPTSASTPPPPPLPLCLGSTYVGVDLIFYFKKRKFLFYNFISPSWVTHMLSTSVRLACETTACHVACFFYLLPFLPLLLCPLCFSLLDLTQLELASVILFQEKKIHFYNFISSLFPTC
jgi:hypothetical protein